MALAKQPEMKRFGFAIADASRQCQTFLGQRRRSLDVAQPQDVCAKQPERTSDTRLIIELAPKVERSLGQWSLGKP